jgi:hypothetical protein
VNHFGWTRGDAGWRFVGRERELQLLLDLLRPGQAVLVCGEAGLGKTALVRTATGTDPGRILYVPEARTCARAAAGIASAMVTPAKDRDRATLKLLRAGRAIRAKVIAGRVATGDVRAVILDHIDEPGRQLAELVERWRERTAVVLVARSDMTIGRVWRSIWGCPRIELGPLEPRTARRLVETVGASLSGSPLDETEITALTRLAQGNPRAIVTTLRLAARSRDGERSIERLVRTARVLAIARERDAVIRARRRALARMLASE